MENYPATADPCEQWQEVVMRFRDSAPEIIFLWNLSDLIGHIHTCITMTTGRR